MIYILTTQVPTNTPEPSPAEVVQQAERIIDIWNSLGPIMAILFVAALALVVVFVIVWSSRNNSNTLLNLLASNNAQKDREIQELREQRRVDQQQHIESLSAIHEQNMRANDLSATSIAILNIMNNQNNERYDGQKIMASQIEALATQGSAPVQEIKAKVVEILGIAGRLDNRTADWNGILTVITPLLVELGALRIEAKKHSTQPIPKIDPPPTGDIVIEGTVSGTIIQGDSP